jgi:hypothetical protein
MMFTWIPDWGWSLSLTALTVSTHVAGVLSLAAVLAPIWARLNARRRPRFSVAVFGVVFLGLASWVLVLLHGLEAAVWAYAYLALEAVNTFPDAILFSADSLTARGASGVQLEPHWRLMGALEAANGLLVYGISTAFLATIIVEVWQSLSAARPVSNETNLEGDVLPDTIK